MMLNGMPIYIATQTYQRRKHKKKRINKKWRKRYGMYEFNLIPKGQMMIMDDVLYMTISDYNNLKKAIENQQGDNQ